MFLRHAALAAVVACAVATGPARAGERLTLDDAFARVVETHPDLRLFTAHGDRLAAERERAAQRPPLALGAEVENAFGNGSADLTLGIGSMFERGGKQAARSALAERRTDALALERETRRLDLLAETARRYLQAAAATQRQAIARDDIAQRQHSVTAARRRLAAGASPRSLVLAAEAAQARAELDLARADRQAETTRRHLTTLWGEHTTAFEIDASILQRLPPIADLDAIEDRLRDSPDLRRFGDERRIREAQLQLARSQAVADIGWQLGARRLGGDSDVGLVAGISVPLGSRRRAGPAIRSAQAGLAALEIEREAEVLSLQAALVEAHGRYRTARLEAGRIDSEVMPALERAEVAAARAYRAGASSHLEWAQLQTEIVAARRQRLDAATEALGALIELQRLTGRTPLDPAGARTSAAASANRLPGDAR
ncbi:TolC family protein [Marilutibacter alkalisoli]|uniref:TolC family protein n=1 Tax=Marilutibacter alkalisoli TaxID=2591633 RepID=A0A514BV05_9GAMM|nr:TolC family protein [Lysobacter alkalisoli]QDH71234.1 TolC family protein [Lysobacter alkalisoli]